MRNDAYLFCWTTSSCNEYDLCVASKIGGGGHCLGLHPVGSLGCQRAARLLAWNQAAASGAQLEQFLNTTESIPKTFVDERQFERSGGSYWRLDPPLRVTFKQAWMASPSSLTLSALHVSQRSNMLTVLLLKVDGAVVPLEGGNLGLLVCP